MWRNPFETPAVINENPWVGDADNRHLRPLMARLRKFDVRYRMLVVGEMKDAAIFSNATLLKKKKIFKKYQMFEYLKKKEYPITKG